MLTFRFTPGARIRDTRTRTTGTVLDFKQLAGENYYVVDLAGEEITLPERDLEPARDIFDRLAAQEKLGYGADFDLVVRATALMAALGQRGMSCLTNARLAAKPHQVFVAHRVLQDLYPRFILADEVGLGKTIEAGLILKELKARGLAERILIITPASLCEQWRGELSTKFNERFVVYNGARIRDNLAQQPNQNPWGRDAHVITSLQFARGQYSTAHSALRQRKDDARAERWIDDMEWDLVIFDEAHHLRRYLKSSSGTSEERETTQSYRLAQALEERTRSLLLLTATPLQTSQYDAYSLMELVDPYLFTSFKEFQRYLQDMSHQEWSKIAAFNRALAFPEAQIPRASLSSLFNDVMQAALHYRTYEDFWSTLFATFPPSTPLRQGSQITLAQLQRCYDYVYSLSRSRTYQVPSMNMDPLLVAVRASGGQARRAPLDLLTQEGLPDLLVAARETILDWISRQHQLSRVMIRNRKREALKGELIDRQATLLSVQLTVPELALYNEVSDYIRHSYAQLLARTTGKRTAVGFILTTFRKLLVSSRSALAVSLEKRAARLEEALRRGTLLDTPLNEDEAEEVEELLDTSEEMESLLNLTASTSRADVQGEILTLRAFAHTARQIDVDSKAEALLACVDKVLASDSTEKVLIFTQFRETQRYLHQLLRGRGYQIALFHGEQSGSGYSKRAEFERFKRDPTIRIMIATDVGGEGLNFQFCRNLINYDLPWNPMNIEQRIGRVDRIGQQRGVRVFNFALEGTLDGRILHVLQERIRIFEETIGTLDPIIGEQIEQAIKAIAFQSDTAAAERRLRELEERLPQRIREAHEATEKLADFVMDAQSFRIETVERILGQEPLVRPTDIEALVRALLERFRMAGKPPLIMAARQGVSKVTVPGKLRELAAQHYDLNLQTEYVGTFDIATGLTDESVDFFAIGHPLVDAVLRFGTDRKRSGLSYDCAIRVLDDPGLAGFEGVQFNYLLVAEGVRTYKQLVPIVLDRNGAYDEAQTRRVFELQADERAAQGARYTFTAEELRRLQATARNILNRLAERFFEENERRHREEIEELRGRQQQIFAFRLRRLSDELSRRQGQLSDARRQRQEQRIRLLEGQIAATLRRVQEIEALSAEDREQIKERHTFHPRIKRLSVAVVQVSPQLRG